MTEGYLVDVVMAAASKKVPHAIVVKDLEPSAALSTYRPFSEPEGRIIRLRFS